MAKQQKVAAVFDLDCTITRGNTYIGFLLECVRRYPARAWRSAWLPIALALYQLSMRDDGWFRHALLRAMAGGISRTEIESFARTYISRLLHSGIRPGAVRTIREHREAGHALIMATAGFDFYVEELARCLGFETVLCTASVWDGDGRLSAEQRGPHCYSDNKLARLCEYFGDARDQWYIVVYTDHHSDLPVMEWVDRPVAVNPNGRLGRLALDRGFEVQDWESVGKDR